MDDKKIMDIMLSMYCKGVHKSNELCSSCSELRDYAHDKIANCKKGVTCLTYEIHCYNSEMSERIKAAHRYSGPRMLFVHPILTAQHFYHVLIKK